MIRSLSGATQRRVDSFDSSGPRSDPVVAIRFWREPEGPVRGTSVVSSAAAWRSCPYPDRHCNRVRSDI